MIALDRLMLLQGLELTRLFLDLTLICTLSMAMCAYNIALTNFL
jgi:hypothetical protein